MLPLISLIFLSLIFHQRDNGWRSSVLSAAILWGLLLTAITEILSLGRLLTLVWLTGIWGLVDFVLIFIYFILLRKRKRLAHRKPDPNLSPFSILLLCGVAFIVAAVGLTALIAAPNNWDSMSYHLPRVVHWMQNLSVAHYPTSYLPQLYQKPWAEFTIMHFQILSGGDRSANLVQWFSMVGSIIGVSLIAKQMGADLRGQVFSAVVCATIPMGILQGSSTQNDYVVSFWLVCFVYYVLLAVQERKSSVSVNSLKIGASLGLAFLTKATAYVYALPFFVWFLLSGIKHFRWKLWKQLFLITLLVFLINLGHEIRNIDLFGHLLASGEEKYTNDVFGISVLISNIIRNISLHIIIPTHLLKDVIERFIRLIHRFLGVGINDPRTTWPGAEFHLPHLTFHEDSAANTIHLLLILGTITLFLRCKNLKTERNIGFYLISLVCGFLLFSFLLKWQPWHSRLHLPLFVLFSAFVGVVLSKLSYYKIANYISLVLILSSLLWVFCNTSRPLLSNKKILSPSNYENIFNTSRIDQYFNNNSELRKPYIGATSFLNSQKCSKVGLSLRGDDWEYPFWILLQKNYNKNYQIEQVDVKNISTKKYQVYPHNNFIPCAIISVQHTKSEESNTKDIINPKGTYVQEWSQHPVSVYIRR